MNDLYCINCTECLKTNMTYICSIHGNEVEPHDCCPLHLYEKEVDDADKLKK